LRDDAGFSWSRYMTEIVGDLDVEATEWAVVAAATGENFEERDNNDDDAAWTIGALSRTIRYTHPVNAPMAPPTARARKEQILRRYGNQRGLVLETKTFVEGIPKTDCFYVRDILKVEPSITHEDRLVVNLRFEVIFVKSTMFWSLISKITTGELTKFTTNLVDYYAKHYVGYSTRGVDNDNVITTPVAVAVVSSSSSSSIEDAPSKEKPTVSTTPSDNTTSQPMESAAITRHSKGNNTTKSSSNKSNNNNYNINSKFEFGWRIIVVVLLLWIGQLQNRVWTETSLMRGDFSRLESRIRDLETARESELWKASEVKSLREDWSEWKETLANAKSSTASESESFSDRLVGLTATLEEFQASRATESESLRNELRELKATLSEAGVIRGTTTNKAAAATDATPGGPKATGRNVRGQEQQKSATWSSRARQAAAGTSGMKLSSRSNLRQPVTTKAKK